MEKITEYIEKNRDNILIDVDRLIRFKSYSDDRECCRDALKFVLDLAKEFGMETGIGKYEDVGFVDLKSGKGEESETMGILVHVDVVPEGDIAKWHTDPFKLTIEGDNFYGRGIVDDKGPVIQSLYAMKYLKDSKAELKKNIRLIIGTSEEIVWTDMEHYKEEFQCPDFGYSPDGEFPIYNRENGYMDIELVFNEAVGDRIVEISGGSAVNSVPSKASYKDSNGNIKAVSGSACHSSTPELGLNAICLLAEYMNREIPCSFAAFMTEYFPLTKYCSNLKYMRSDGRYNEESDLTIVPTTLWMEDGKICVNLNVRQSYMIPGKNILEGLKLKADEFGFDIRITENMEPILVETDKPWLQRMFKITGNNGVAGGFCLGRGCSYAKSMPEFVSWGPVFMGDPDSAHMEDEVQPVSSFFKAQKMYIEYLLEEASVK